MKEVTSTSGGTGTCCCGSEEALCLDDEPRAEEMDCGTGECGCGCGEPHHVVTIEDLQTQSVAPLR